MEFVGLKGKEFWDEVKEVWDKGGDADKLGAVAEGWVTYVGDALGEIASILGLDKMRTTIEWEGRAARAYQASEPPKVVGLNAIKNVAGQLCSSLNSLANALEGFWIAAVAAAVSYMNTIDTEQSAIRQKVRDPGANWTMPNLSELSDAIVRDGDGSDWRPGS